MVAALDPFSMFMLTTGPAFLKTDEDIRNAVVRNSYFLPRFLEGKEMNLLLQGGTKIQDVIYLQEDSDAEFYSATSQDFDYRNQQVGTAWEANWRFLKNATMWTDHEVGLNEGGGLSDRIGRFHRFKRIQKLKFMNLWTTQIHKIEDGILATANRDTMEDGTGIPQPFSLGCFLTTNSSAGNTGLPNTGSSSGAWTTVQGVTTPHVGNTTGKWRNQLATYSVTSGAVSGFQFWGGMRELHSKCRFERLPRFGAYSDPTRSPTFYAVSLWGLMLAETSMRSDQDAYLAGRQDAAYPSPMFSGVPFVFIAGLGTARIINDPAGVTNLADEQGNGTPANPTAGTYFVGPRVWAIQGSALNLVMHRDRVMHRLPPFSPDRQPFTKVLVTDTWYNMTCQNRRENGVLQPTADVTALAAPQAGV